MKKFSSVTNQKIGVEPTNEMSKEELELLNIKSTIHSLMDNCLSVKTRGAIRQYVPQFTIDGKEFFIEKLLDLMSDKSFKDQVKILESIKSTTRDWETVDNKIDEIYKNINESAVSDNLLPHIEKIKFLINTYGDTQLKFDTALSESLGKITNAEVAQNRAIAADKMMLNLKYSSYPKDKLKIISEKYLNRYNELKKS